MDEIPPFQRHSWTSLDAALHEVDARAGHQRLVLAFIKSRGTFGATDDEIQEGTGMNPSTQRPRRVELWRAGKIETREGWVRKTRTGRNAAVWFYVEPKPKRLFA